MKFSIYSFFLFYFIFQGFSQSKKDIEKALFNPSYKELKTKGNMIEYFDSIGYVYSNFKYNVATKIPKKWKYDQGLTKHMIFRAYDADSAYTYSINVIETKYNVQKIFDKEYNKSKDLFKNKFIEATQAQLNTQIYDVYDRLTYLKNRKSIRWEYKFMAKGDDYEIEMISIMFQVMIDNLTYTFGVSAPIIYYNKNPRFFNTIFNGIHFMPDKTKLKKILIGE